MVKYDKQGNKIHDLGLKIATKEESAWLAILKQAEAAYDNGLVEAEINQCIIELAKSKIRAEKQKI